MIVPSSDTVGFSGSADLTGCRTATGATRACAGGGGGRRDGEKIGRSRVIDNCLSGSAHSGFPDGASASWVRAASRAGTPSPTVLPPARGATGTPAGCGAAAPSFLLVISL